MEIINVYDSDGNTINCLVQWDRDVNIYIDEPGIDMEYHIDFYNDISEDAYMVQTEYTDRLRAKIPNELLTQPYPVKGYIVVTNGEETKSLYGFTINLKLRPRPSDYIYVEDDDYVRLDTILNQCRQAASAADASQQKAAKSETNASSSEKAAKDAQVAAQASADIASGKATAAGLSADNALKSENNAKDWSLWAQSYAEGTGGKREGEATANAKYYYEQTNTIADAFDAGIMLEKLEALTQRITALENELSMTHVPGYIEPAE